MSGRLCEAAAMDAANMLNADGLDGADLVPPCDEPAEVDVCGFALCEGCADAFWLFVELGARLKGRGAL